MKDYQGALKDLDKAYVLEPNNAFILQKMLEDFQEALKDLEKANVFEPNNAFTLLAWTCQKDFEGLSKSLRGP